MDYLSGSPASTAGFPPTHVSHLPHFLSFFYLYLYGYLHHGYGVTFRMVYIRGLSAERHGYGYNLDPRTTASAPQVAQTFGRRARQTDRPLRHDSMLYADLNEHQHENRLGGIFPSTHSLGIPIGVDPLHKWLFRITGLSSAYWFAILLLFAFLHSWILGMKRDSGES